MKKRVLAIISFLLVVVMMGSLFTGCGNQQATDGNANKSGSEGKPSYGGVIRFPMTQELDTLDPQEGNSMPAGNISMLCYEGLTRVSAGKVAPGAAESWDISEDGLTYTFHLRDSKWSNGTPVTAHDFENGIKRLVNPDNGFAYSWAAGAIVNAYEFNAGEVTDPSLIGVKAIDDKTLEIKLNYPANYFLGYLQMACFQPVNKEWEEQQGEAFGTEADTAIYNGPFVVTEWAHEQSMTLTKNPDYWNAEAIYLDGIEAIRVNEETTAINMYENGELDFCNVPANFVDQYKQEGTLMLDMSGADDWIKFNMANDEKPWLQNVNFRKAINYAIDREEIMNLSTNGVYYPATRFVLPIMAGAKKYYVDEHPLNIYSKNAEPDKAKKHLELAMKELGITNAADIEVEFLMPDSEINRLFSEALQDQVSRNLGITITLKLLQRKQQLAMDMNGEFDMVYSGWAPDYDDPLTYLEYYQSTNASNSGKYSNPEYDELVEKGRYEADVVKRGEYFAQAEKLLLEDAAIAPLNFRQRAWTCKDNVKNVVRFFIGSDLDLTYAYIEK